MSDIDTTLATEAINIVNGSRQKAYDRPERNFARIALAWESITDRAYTAEEVGLMMAAMKVVRAAHKFQRDNFVDAIGYLLCADAARSDDKPGDVLSAAAEDYKNAVRDAYLHRLGTSFSSSLPQPIIPTPHTRQQQWQRVMDNPHTGQSGAIGDPTDHSPSAAQGRFLPSRGHSCPPNSVCPLPKGSVDNDPRDPR